MVNTSTNIYFGKLHYGPKIILKFSKGGGRIFKVNFKRFKRFRGFGLDMARYGAENDQMCLLCFM